MLYKVKITYTKIFERGGTGLPGPSPELPTCLHFMLHNTSIQIVFTVWLKTLWRIGKQNMFGGENMGRLNIYAKENQTKGWEINLW